MHVNSNNTFYDLIVVGAGAAGMMAAIVAARRHKRVLLLEKLSRPGAKLKATGGGRCNLTNTLDVETFMKQFGREGRFMMPALNAFDSRALMDFYREIGVETHAPDGFRVFPSTHSSETILTALEKELIRLDVDLVCQVRVECIEHDRNSVQGVKTEKGSYLSSCVVIATGGLGYPTLGAEGDGFNMAQTVGHKIAALYPAMMPLRTKETWVANCRADTIAKAQLRVDLPKAKKLQATGDLIFTKNGIRGPVVLDFAREVTPLLEKYGEVPLRVNMLKGMHEDMILQHFKQEADRQPDIDIVSSLQTLMPESVVHELCGIVNVDPAQRFSRLTGEKRDELLKILAKTPLTVVGHDGFKMAMITRGGVSLKEIRPETMESKILSGLFFCGEVMNLDGPCGGYNLQWSFASGYIAGHVGEEVGRW